MSLWVALAINSLSFAGLLFLLSAGFSLVFGLMRIPNLAHGAFFMLGAYVGYSFIRGGLPFWIAAIASAAVLALFGAVVERVLLRRLLGSEQAQVLVTLGLSFIIADFSLAVWTGNSLSVPFPPSLRGSINFFGIVYPTYRLLIIALAALLAVVLYAALERTRLGAKIRAGVDDCEMAQVSGIRVSRLFTAVFCVGAALAGLGGVIGAPILSIYPGLDMDMLPLALVVVVIGGMGSIFGSLIGSICIGFLYNFGQVILPQFTQFIVFLPMIFFLAFRPQGLFGRHSL